ncbi:MAG: phosphodiester glycosidase family protein [Bacteroidia bacterium]
MKNGLRFLFLFLFWACSTNAEQSEKQEGNKSSSIISYEVDVLQEHCALYWKDDDDSLLLSLGRLKEYVESKNQSLSFAMNGGMYMKDHRPQGLFIQAGKTIVPLDTHSGEGNFYLKPNGVFYLTAEKEAGVCTTSDFKTKTHIQYATQSGPMLLTNGNINPVFTKGSSNLFVRNGVGILANQHILFAMSKKPINFYDFATFFKEKGCKEALYLDGFVSRTYLPAKDWKQTDGEFGVMIGVTVSN